MTSKKPCPPCPNCGSVNTISKGYADKQKTKRRCLCKNCGKYFSVPIEQTQESKQQEKPEPQQISVKQECKSDNKTLEQLSERVEHLEQVVAQLAQELQRLADLLEDLSETCC